jgi:hypothetical protein
MSLLSPSESNAFQSFLSTMDYPDEAISASDWAIYNSSAAMHQVLDDPLLENSVNPGHREALAKATKDLMSLDSDMWDAGSSMMDHHPNTPHQAFDAHGRHNGNYDHQLLAHQQQVLQHQRQQHQQRQNSFSTNRDIFPFLHNKQQPTPLQYMQQQQQHAQMSSMNSLSHSSTTSSFGFQQRHNSISMTPPLHHQQQQPSQQQQQVNIPQQPQRGASPVSRGTRLRGAGSARSLSGSSRPSTSAPNGNDASTSSAGARNNTADAAGTSKRVRTSTSPPIVNRTGQPQKPTLLSPSQKKANHIQSEQKRRANIRRGYEALCETVPALREAIREEEEQERMSNSGSGTRKKTRNKKGAKDGDERDKDRLDGRAGPRSENVVLSKSEYFLFLVWSPGSDCSISLSIFEIPPKLLNSKCMRICSLYSFSNRPHPTTNIRPLFSPRTTASRAFVPTTRALCADAADFRSAMGKRMERWRGKTGR